MEFSDKNHNDVQVGSVKSLQTLYAEIQKLVGSGKEREAIGALEMFLALYPDYALADNDLGVLYYKSGDKEKSLQHYQKAAELQPENIAFQKNLADFYYVELGQVKEAMQIYNKIIAANPKDFETLLIMGHICVTLQLFNNAIEFYKIVLKLDPANKDARQNLYKLEYYKLKPEEKELAVKAKNLAKDDYLVSAIVSTYNSDRFIRGCLEDLEAQTIADRLEIVVVNSGSEQNEEAIVKEFQKKYSNIKYIKTEERETVYAAWNRGIKASTGKYITNANTDDRHRKDALEVMSKMLETLPKIALVYADVVITETENETFKNCTPVGYFHWRNWKREDLLNKGCFMGPQPMWRRDVHNEYGYFDDSFVVSGDYEFWLRISQTRNFLHIPVQLGLYLRSPGSIEHSNREKQRKENNKIFKLYKDVNSSDKNISETAARLETDNITSLKNLADFYYVEQGR